MRREGTKNYTTDSQLLKLFDLLKYVTEIIKDVSDKENEKCIKGENLSKGRNRYYLK